jgi:hypothetical protein
MPRNNARVNIPTNPTEQITLLGKVSAKHTDLRADSPLGSLQWTEIDAALAEAKSHDEKAADLTKQTEREYRARDAAMPKVTQALRDARDLLLVANRQNPKMLGDFGYVVDDSPQAKAKAKPAP